LKPLTKEQWEEIQELRPRTPFESRLARNHARIRTGEPLSLEDIKDWAIDVLTDAMARKEDNLRQWCRKVVNSNSDPSNQLEKLCASTTWYFCSSLHKLFEEK
jgi:hypothetical protein